MTLSLLFQFKEKLKFNFQGNMRPGKLLADKRIAFLMAWNKRLGEKALISKIINKDVARMIARYYLTDRSQKFIRDGPKHIKHSELRNVCPAVLPEKPYGSDSVTFVPLCVIDRAMLSWRNVLIQTPSLTLWADLGEGDRPTFISHSRHQKFYDDIKTFEQNGIECLREVFSRKKILVASYSDHSGVVSLFREDGDKKFYDGFRMNSKPRHQPTVFYKKKKIPLKQAIRQKLIGRGSKVKMLIKHNGFICDYSSIMMQNDRVYPGMFWTIEQILLLRPRPDWELERFAFLDDDD